MNLIPSREMTRFLCAEHVHTSALLSLHARICAEQTKYYFKRENAQSSSPLGFTCSKNNLSFIGACDSGSFSVLQFWVESFASRQEEKAITEFELTRFNGYCVYNAFQLASLIDRVDVFHFFARQFDQARLEAAFKSSDYLAFKWASEHGCISTLEFFVRQFDQVHLEAAFADDAFQAFRQAAKNGHANVLELFAHQFSQEHLKAAFEAQDPYRFRVGVEFSSALRGY